MPPKRELSAELARFHLRRHFSSGQDLMVIAYEPVWAGKT